MRRAAAILVLLLVAVPLADAAGWRLLSHRYSTEPGWIAESFTLLEGDRIAVVLGLDSDSEVNGHVIGLYDDSDRWIGGVTLFSTGGRSVDLVAQTDVVRVSTEDKPGLGTGGLFERTLYFTCDATCNPSRTFKLLVATGGELESWGYGLFVENGTKIANTSGSEAWARSTRDFSGTVLHASTRVLGVASVAPDATWAVDVDDTFVGAFVKFSTARPERMLLATPASDVPCDCVVGDGPPGAYAFRYADTDTSGREGYAVAADVRLP